MKAPLDHLRSKKKPFTRKLPVCMDSEIADEFDAVKAERDQLQEEADTFTKMLERPVPEELARKLEDARARFDDVDARLDEATETFVFLGLDRDAYDELIGKHPPTKKQSEKDVRAEFNPDTFPEALCAASCSSHELGVDGWKELFHDPAWNAAETTNLFQTALLASTGMRVVDMGKGSGEKRG